MTANGSMENVEQAVGFLAQLSGFFSSLMEGAKYGQGFLVEQGLGRGHSAAIVLVVFLVGFLGVLKFLGIVMKILIAVLIFWVVLSVVGIL